ncbi:MAG: mceE [Friedmanniella sp.]|nr:mceE [Friedmanniella sp.]
MSEQSAVPGGPAAVGGLRTLGIDHVGVAVPDLDEAVERYRGLGLEVSHREENPAMGVQEAMLSSPTGVGTELQLVAPLGPHSAIGRFLDRSGPGLQHLALRVADVDDAARTLRGRGLRLLYDAPRIGTRGTRINFVHPKDCGGVLIELVEQVDAV